MHCGCSIRVSPRVLFAVILFFAFGRTLNARPASHIVISEIYGGGGNSGALYTHDFIELYNPTSSEVVMNGWSVQYQAGGGSGAFTSRATFSGVIRPHGFFLIQANPGSGGTQALPEPDAVAGFSMAATSGKVALCSDTTPVISTSDPGVVDFVGYGTANLFEGSAPAAAPGNTTSIERKAGAASDSASMAPGGAEEHSGNGHDSGENGYDFLRRGPQPQNDASPAETPGGIYEVTTGYRERWNLVSLPVGVADPAVTAAFPGAVTPLYSFSDGYVPDSTAVPGAGYWVRFAEPETVTFSGEPIDRDTLSLAPGWNLIGSISVPVSVAGLVQIPEGHLTGMAFEFEGGYQPADTIHPGRAYWIRSTTGGLLVLAAPEGFSATGFHSPR